MREVFDALRALPDSIVLVIIGVALLIAVALNTRRTTVRAVPPVMNIDKPEPEEKKEAA